MPFTRHTHEFDVPVPLSTVSNQLNEDKELLRESILELRQRGMTYREIGRRVGLHFTRVGQIVRDESGQRSVLEMSGG